MLVLAQLGDQPGTCNPDATARSIVVQITDQCPQCESNHWDIQALTWAKVRSRLARCPAHPIAMPTCVPYNAAC